MVCVTGTADQENYCHMNNLHHLHVCSLNRPIFGISEKNNSIQNKIRKESINIERIEKWSKFWAYIAYNETLIVTIKIPFPTKIE